MRISTITWLLVFSIASVKAQSRKYEYTVDLASVVNDRVRVELICPAASGDEIIFYMPRIVPGTYAIADYGRFVNDLVAADRRGNRLPTERLNVNAWKISNARRLHTIQYWVDDSFDATDDGPDIFWPAGTNIEEGKNFLINTGGFFGFLEGMKDVSFQINVRRPAEFYGCTGMISVPGPSKKANTDRSARSDVFLAANYEELIDSPLMYSAPDTAVLRIGNTEVLVGCYSPNKVVHAREIAASIHEVLLAQWEFLGKLPVDKYAFIFYFTDQPVMSYGALEHSYSSVYYMPEEQIADMDEQLKDIAAHEFFHILTPLTIHSEQIHNFDFNNPSMSRHLWMYEGVIEYFASTVRVKHGLISPDQFLKILAEKMHTSDQFLKDVPFTDISKHAHDKYHDQFYNVYQKGALIALCLDLKLLKLSSGKYDLRKLMLELSEKYGKDKAFEDAALFDEITRMTYPQIGEFFNRYVRGIEVLPLAHLLNVVGVQYAEEKKVQDYSLGISRENVGVTQHEGRARLQITTVANQDTMGVALGLQEGDILIGINEEPLPDLGPELGEMLHKQYKKLRERETLSYTVLRANESGEYKEVKLTAPVTRVAISKRHLIQFDPAASPEQLRLRELWLKP